MVEKVANDGNLEHVDEIWTTRKRLSITLEMQSLKRINKHFYIYNTKE